MSQHKSFEERFYDRVIIIPFHACHEWTGLRDKNGYGHLSKKENGIKRNVRAPRVALEWKLGRKLLPGEQALHRCDNPGCVNPDHLFVGTGLDNMRDKIAKGRMTGPCATNKLKTHCFKGHPYDEVNTGRRYGKRFCRECHRVRSRETAYLQKHGKPWDASVVKSNGAKTHCPHGHAYSEENTYLRIKRSGISRACKTCVVARERRKRQLRREAQVTP